jgi:hypothetical protein
MFTFSFVLSESLSAKGKQGVAGDGVKIRFTRNSKKGGGRLRARGTSVNWNSPPERIEDT